MGAKLQRDGIGWILAGQEFPPHLQIAYGRYIFRLMHLTKSSHRINGIWLRDLPLNLIDLAREYGYHHALTAFNIERRNIGMDDL